MAAVGVPFADRVVVITGAGGAIGRAMCVGFAADGATVVAIGRREDTLDGTAALCSRPITSVCADLRRPDECFRAIEEVISKHRRIDVLVNCAGTFGGGLFLEAPFQEWADTVALNAVGVAACCRAALPHMIEQGYGRIVTIASRLAGTKSPGASAYSASKAAVSALTSCLGAELASHPNVLINDLIPGPTKGAMSNSGQEPAAVYPYVRRLALLPSGGASGQMFFKGSRYSLFGIRQAFFRLPHWRAWASSYLKRFKTR